MERHIRARFAVVVAMVFAAAAMRVLPHPPNFTPVAAMALFAGARFDRLGAALAVPLGAMLLSDIALEMLYGWGFHHHIFAVYASFLACVGFGVLLRRPLRALWIGGASLVGSTTFFVVTNFSVWALDSYYPHTPMGLVTCYATALPFFGPTVAGDLLYTSLLFGAFALAERQIPILAPRSVVAR